MKPGDLRDSHTSEMWIEDTLEQVLGQIQASKTGMRLR
jgi:hypothetical protein